MSDVFVVDACRTPIGRYRQTAEVLAAELGITRDDQDTFALDSHRKACAAAEAGRFDAELEPLAGLEADESPRPSTTAGKLAALPPAFARDGTVTAGNSSPLNDGAAALLLATADAAEHFSLRPIVRIVTTAVAGVEPRRMGIGPVPATEKALGRAGWKLEDVAHVELNEAFAAQSLAVIRTLGLDPERVNPDGGAIALGHPVGCSGARILATLVHRLAGEPAGTRAMASLCIGVGQGITTLIERI